MRHLLPVLMVNGDVASVQIAPRNRQIVNGAVRRLGFAPIPGRRSNSNLGASRGERADWDDPAPNIRSQTLPGCIQAKHAAAKSPDAVFWAGGHAAHAGNQPGRAGNFSRLSMRGARAGHTPMRAGRGDNAPLMKGRGSVGIGECVSMPMSVALSRWEVNENTPKCHGRPI